MLILPLVLSNLFHDLVEAKLLVENFGKHASILRVEEEIFVHNVFLNHPFYDPPESHEPNDEEEPVPHYQFPLLAQG